MKYVYSIHPLVIKDYQAAYTWYEARRNGLGERFIKAVRQKVEETLINPQLFGSRKNKKFREARIEFFPYVIVYKIDKKLG